jgi:hypothetical protein
VHETELESFEQDREQVHALGLVAAQVAPAERVGESGCIGLRDAGSEREILCESNERLMG